MTIPKTHPLYRAVEALRPALCKILCRAAKEKQGCVGTSECQGCWQTSAVEAIRALETAGYKVVGPEPTETQWGGLARAVVMWCQMTAPHTPNSLLKHLERTGEALPEWLMAEPEMANRDHSMSKGTIASIIWRAMHAAAPTITETEKA